MERDPKYDWFRMKLMGPNRDFIYYYFRGITQRELRIARKKEDAGERLDAENYLLSSCVLNEIDWPNMWEGVAICLLTKIYKVSGLDEESLTFAEALEWLKSETGSLEAAAIATIPSCTPLELDTCDPKYYARYILVGKVQFESTWGIKVEEAWNFDNIPSDGSIQVNRADRAQMDSMNRQGEAGVGQDQMTFNWKKGQGLNVDLNRPDYTFFSREEDVPK